MAEDMIIFTSKRIDQIEELGGTGWWKLDARRAAKADLVVLCHNAHDLRGPGDPARHGKAFMIATIADIQQDHEDSDGRWLIQFEKYAPVDGGYDWPGFRNPVTYLSDDSFVSELKRGAIWKTMPKVSLETAMAARRRDDASVHRMQQRAEARADAPPRTFAEVIEHHRNALAAELGVEPARVSISVGF